jgi:putative ABC transport system substrate-binding protein
MKRRQFIRLIGGAVATWPVMARAQQTPVIGFLNGQSPDNYSHLAAAFRRGLREAGFVDGQNAIIEYRWANGQDERLPMLAAELIERNVTVLVSSGGVSASIAAQKATKTVPIVFLTGSDPVRYGFVTSISHPEGNATGVSFLVNQLNAKRLELAAQLVPNSRMVGFMFRPSNPTSTTDMQEVEIGASTLGIKLITFKVESVQDFDTAFAAAATQRVGIVLVHTDPFFNSNRSKLVAAAEKHAVPAVYELREFVTEGGLASYGTNIVEAYRQLGTYAGRIVKGEKPSDLPVLQSTRFELAINLRTAKALNIVIPLNLLVAADEVIE